MDVLLTILAFLAIIVVLVLVHEIGHFAVAKWSGVAVQEFGVGFPPRIASVVFRGTRYSLNAIPLGGFVKMLGEDGEIEVERLRERGLSDAAIEKSMEGALSRRRVPIRHGTALPHASRALKSVKNRAASTMQVPRSATSTEPEPMMAPAASRGS